MIQRRSPGFRAGILLGWLGLLAIAGTLFAAPEKLPPRPPTYFTDQPHVVDPGTAQAIERQLEQFERDTSNQILVAIYPNLPPDASVDQYSIDTYNSWQVGQKGKDNGAVLFVFVQDHKMFICTGRGLEGALPDATCKNIISQIIAPAFRQGNYTAGVQDGVNAMLAATRGEYRGTGKTANDQSSQGIPPWIVILFIVLFILARMFFPRSGSGPIIYTGGGWGGGGGGFSGGGGSSAGGGAGGSW